MTVRTESRVPRWRASALLALAASGCATTLEQGELERHVSGSGRPVVVFQSGLGDGLGVWSAVQSRLPGNMTAVAFSRPGYGRSAGHDGDHSPCAAASELRAHLRRSGFAPPYVLVGHSLGGLYQYAFAKLYPDDVGGIVLLEPTHPQHWPRMQQEAPAMAVVVRTARLAAFSPTMRREFDDQQRCLDSLSALPAPPVPTRVLVRGRFVPPETGAFENMSRALWRDWPALLHTTAVEPVEGTGHYVQKDKPAAVVDAIRAVATPLQ
ncbi:MAG: alpha/beta hydrolase [Burkholderiales bacterium]|nr:alpha/beta hydrolase [Burkholderiales bacterium]